MAMTRKDFQALAAIVREVPEQGCGPEWLAARLADFCAGQNPRFNRSRFLGACEPIPMVADVEGIVPGCSNCGGDPYTSPPCIVH